MREQFRNQKPQLREVEAAHVSPKPAGEATESNVQSVTASEAILQCEVCQVARREGKFRDEDARMLQGCNHKVEDVLFERDGLQVCLNSTTSQLLGARSSWMAAHEGREQSRGRLAGNHLRLESLLAYLVFESVDRMACLVRDKVTAHCSRVRNVIF